MGGGAHRREGCGGELIRHLLVTNDFPPKHGGIQSMLWELWRRLPSSDVTVVTTPFAGSAEWDAKQAFRIVRVPERVLLPKPGLARRVDALADEVGAELVVLDPALPLGLIGARLEHRYGVVLHGAEVAVPGRLPGARAVLRSVLRGASVVIAAGPYPLAEGERAAGCALRATNVPPGVDTERFRALDRPSRAAARARLGLPVDALVVTGISRLVPRKGFDVLLRASGRLAPRYPDLVVAIAGAGRDRTRLARVAAEAEAPVRFLGRVPDDAMPELHGSGDVFAMLCRNRWFGLEQEGFGIVFLEAAAVGVPQLAGNSGGSADAVVEGETGLVVADPSDLDAVTASLDRLLGDEALRRRMGIASRERAEAEFSYDTLARRLRNALDAVEG
ncbi:MAG: glycosyltransferase family 4 protein [Acidimicrobiales bacterium]